MYRYITLDIDLNSAGEDGLGFDDVVVGRWSQSTMVLLAQLLAVELASVSS